MNYIATLRDENYCTAFIILYQDIKENNLQIVSFFES